MNKLKSIDSKTWYKIFAVLALFVFIDIMVLGRLLQIPFFGAGVLYPISDSFFSQDTAFGILGIYSSSWIFFGVIALAIKPKREENSENSGNSD